MGNMALDAPLVRCYEARLFEGLSKDMTPSIKAARRTCTIPPTTLSQDEGLENVRVIRGVSDGATAVRRDAVDR